MITANYPFDNSANYTFNSDDLEVTGGLAQLVNVLDPLTFTEDFASNTGFTYNSSNTEFSGGQVQQIDQTPANSVLGATYTSSINASWHKTGSTTGTANGTPAIVSNRLDCSSASPVLKGVYYGITHDGQAAIKVKYTPDYSGAPGSNINIIGIQEPSVTNNRILLFHSPSGDNFRIYLSDSAGTAIYSAVTIGGSGIGLVSGTTYEIELNWDNVAGTVRVFRDGALHGTLTPGAWSFTANAARLYAGAMPSAYDVADAFYEDLVFFSTVQHTSAYTPGYSLTETIYLNDAITLPQFVHSGTGNILELTDFSTTESGAPLYQIKVDSNNFQYWTGAAWSDSDGTYAQSSTAANINTNLATLPNIYESSIITVKIRTTDTNTQGSVSDLSIDYTGGYDYSTTAVTIQPSASLNANSLQGFSASGTIPSGDNIQHIIIADGQAKYVSSGTWINSNGTISEANDADTIDAVATGLSIANTVTFRSLLVSGDGTTTPQLHDVSLSYNFDAPEITVDTITVFGYVFNPDGEVDTDATVSASVPVLSFTDNVQIQPLPKQTTTVDTDGSWELSLIPSSLTGRKYKFEFVSSTGRKDIAWRYVTGTGDTVEFKDLA